MAAKIEHRVENGIELKWCNPCRSWVLLTNFSPDKRRWDGLANGCKSCHAKSGRTYYSKPQNKARRLEQARAWAKANPDRMRLLVRKNKRKKYKTPEGKINNTVSCGIRGSLRNQKNGCNTKGGVHWETLLGYTLQDLMKHLESQFKRDFTWDNHGAVWHIDHIIPISAHNFKTPQDSDFQRCWALNNLRPLEILANKQKAGKVLKPFQPNLF